MGIITFYFIEANAFLWKISIKKKIIRDWLLEKYCLKYLESRILLPLNLDTNIENYKIKSHISLLKLFLAIVIINSSSSIWDIRYNPFGRKYNTQL